MPAEYAKDAFDFVKQLVIVEIQCRPGTGHVALPGGLMADDDTIIYRMIYFSACKYQARIYYAINDKYHLRVSLHAGPVSGETGASFFGLKFCR
ncbi:hypothetical protein EC179100_5158 [Escherichia coli 179100]|nr:hypothetical protein EC179100_5158 [Escherichia coli 179100]